MSHKLVEFVVLPHAFATPQYQHEGDAGADLYAAHGGVIYAGERATVTTGICLRLAEGVMAEIRSRSGLAQRDGISVLNSPGTIDTGYRGELKVLLQNNDPTHPYYYERGDRIAQLVVQKFIRADFVQVASFVDNTTRDTGGFGSTGVSSGTLRAVE